MSCTPVTSNPPCFWGHFEVESPISRYISRAQCSVLTFDVTSAVYASACGKCLASVMKKFNKKIDRKNPNFGNKTAILKNIYF